MRPKKKILLIDSDEDRRATWSLVLRTHSFDVLVADSVAACDVVVGFWPVDPQFADLGSRFHSPTILCAENIETAPLMLGVTSTLHSRFELAPWLMLEAVKLHAARKRGPKKGYKRIPGMEIAPEDLAIPA